MPIATRRKPVSLMNRLRRPLSLGTLQMMVMSGVVRRADLNPPPAPPRYESADNQRGASPQQSASEQGWLSRMFLGRRAQAAANRS